MFKSLLVAGFLFFALTLPIAQGAATPIQRLTYAKAVAYWKAQGKQHGMTVACLPWTAKWVSSDYGCTFGTVNRVDVVAQSKTRCELVVGVYEKTHSVRGGNALTGSLGNVRVPMCKRGWQANLPSPWNLPPSN